MSFTTNKLLGIGNLRIVLSRPSIIIGLLSNGKIGAYRVFLSGILKELSKTDTEHIELAFKLSNHHGSLTMPDKLSILNKNIELANMVMLYYLVRINRPHVVLETGVWTGKTSWAILRALEDNNEGDLISIDLGVKKWANSNLPTNEIGGLVPTQLRSRWRLIIGDSKRVLPDLLGEVGTIDLFYHDSDHSYEQMIFEFKTILPHLRNGGVLSSDDVSLNNAFAEISHYLRNATVIGNKFGYGIRSQKKRAPY